MIIHKLTACTSCVLLTAVSAGAQCSFQNLNFENANPVPIVGGEYPEEVTPGSALPGWGGSIGGVPVTAVILNTYSLGAASIDIFGPGWNSVNPGIIGGNYTVFLQAGGPSPLSAGGNASISQNGTIPANAQSLQFNAWNDFGNTALFVSFDGNSLSPVVLSSGQTPSGQLYGVYGVNIAPYAGETGQIEFTAIVPNWIELDDITFSPTAVPEPSTLALVIIGGLALAARRWRGKRP